MIEIIYVKKNKTGILNFHTITNIRFKFDILEKEELLKFFDSFPNYPISIELSNYGSKALQKWSKEEIQTTGYIGSFSDVSRDLNIPIYIFNELKENTGILRF